MKYGFFRFKNPSSGAGRRSKYRRLGGEFWTCNFRKKKFLEKVDFQAENQDFFSFEISQNQKKSIFQFSRIFVRFFILTPHFVPRGLTKITRAFRALKNIFEVFNFRSEI